MRWQDAHKKTSHDPYTLSRSFVKALYNLDEGRLRIRWSQRAQQWSVERKVARATTYINHLEHYRRVYTGQFTYIMAENDSWIRARDGYIGIGFVTPKVKPGQWLIKNLEYYRIERWGGAAGAAEKMERAEERIATQKLREQRQRWSDIASETWDSYCWEGHRVAVPSNYKKA